MAKNKENRILHDHNDDGIDRRGFLECMAWAGTGALCVMQGGVLKSYQHEPDCGIGPESGQAGELSFVQISDSHMGFNKPANPDVAGTLKAAVDKINALPTPPEFMLHTGDISHLSKPEEFDTVDQILKGASAKDVFYVPGEHDVLERRRQDSILERYGKGTQGRGLVQLRQEGRALHRAGERDESEGWRTGHAGPRAARVAGRRREASEAQHADRGVRAHSAVDGVSGVGLGHGRQRAGTGLSEEIRLGDGAERAHSPDDAEGRRQRDVSHRDVHGVSATAARQGRSPGPMKVPAEQLRSVLGITDVNYVQGQHAWRWWIQRWR